jgi:16S rRNA (guanine527-N7)-methyltransferase
MYNILDINTFCQTLKKQGFVISVEQKELFEQYYNLLTEWNKKINLISRNEKNIIDRHFLNSALVAHFVKFNPGEIILDIGSGGGFPAIVLKILFPDSHFTLIESIKKKTDFLNQIVDRLNLKKINVVTGRAENLSSYEIYKKSFDYVTARAVASLEELFTLSSPFLKRGGRMLFLKGKNYEKEISSSKLDPKTVLVCRLDRLDNSQDGVLLIVSPT